MPRFGKGLSHPHYKYRIFHYQPQFSSFGTSTLSLEDAPDVSFLLSLETPAAQFQVTLAGYLSISSSTANREPY